MKAFRPALQAFFHLLLCTQEDGRRVISWPSFMHGLVDLNRKTGIEDNTLFLFAFKSGPAQKRAFLSSPRAEPFLPVYLPVKDVPLTFLT